MVVWSVLAFSKNPLVGFFVYVIVVPGCGATWTPLPIGRK